MGGFGRFFRGILSWNGRLGRSENDRFISIDKPFKDYMMLTREFYPLYEATQASTQPRRLPVLSGVGNKRGPGD